MHGGQPRQWLGLVHISSPRLFGGRFYPGGGGSIRKIPCSTLVTLATFPKLPKLLKVTEPWNFPKVRHGLSMSGTSAPGVSPSLSETFYDFQKYSSLHTKTILFLIIFLLVLHVVPEYYIHQCMNASDGDRL
jgi:hypothetical protein